MQFYFLSVATNLLAGIALAGDYLAPRFPGLQPLLQGLADRTGRLTLGGVTAAVGALKLLVLAPQVPNAQTVVVGDLIPALAGLAAGGALLAAALRPAQAEQGAAEESAPQVAAVDGPVEKTAQFALAYRLPLGLVSAAAAVLHFLFPSSPLL